MTKATVSTTLPVRPLVLVVDDDPAVLEALSSLLAPRLEPLYSVETAASAEEALELVASTDGASRPVALVISDEKMPGRSGTDLLIALRQHPAHRDGGRIVITAYAGLASAKKAINEAEVDRYYPKPWDADGALLPAVGEILARFNAKRAFDRFLTAGATTSGDMHDLKDVRRAWWEYISLFGEESAEGDPERPSFDEPEDEGATLILARRLSPRENRPAGTIRLRKAGGGWLLDGLAFLPEEAGDELETLLLRAAVLQAAGEGIETLHVEAPVLRREVYEAIGFAAVGDGKQGSATVPMEIAPVDLAGRAVAHAARFRRDRRLCFCAQTSCPDNDYASDRRGYLCPLDMLERRLPEGFPRESVR